MTRERAAALAALALAAATALFLVLLLARIGHPLFWHDEAETAAFSERVLRFGYPKIHDGKNTLYSLWPPWRAAGIGIDEASDAYTGSPWLQYYVGALGVAWGAGEPDLYERSARVRLPFAWLGCVGLGWLFWTLRSAFGPGRARTLAFAALYVVLLAGSVTLLLHLREARHYALTVLGTAAFCSAWLRRHAFGAGSFAAYVAWGAGALLWLFHSFHPAAVALGASAGLWLAGRASRRPGDARARLAWLARESAPLALAALAILPQLGFFDFFAQTQGWVEHFGDPARYPRNAAFVLTTLLRHEWLAPALVLQLAVWRVVRGGGAPAGEAQGAARRTAAGFLSLAIGVYALAVCGIPFLFERYFVVLGPLIALVLLLDLATLLDAAPPARCVARAGLVAGSLAALVVLGLRAPELAGRVAEIRTPYRGPLDFVIPYLAQRYPDPSALVIATNYEEPAFMFYLGSRVTVGFYGANLPDDAAVAPDVIVPRPWPDHIELLKQLAASRHYGVKRFPVGNLRWNNTPSLSARVGASAGHRFRAPVVDVDGPELFILERVAPPAPGSGAAAP
jgi:hypothetical protein